MLRWRPRYFDIGVNFSDAMFHGRYNGSSEPRHAADIERVVRRARVFHVERMLITASTVLESRSHLDMCAEDRAFRLTVGVHPCSVSEEFYGGGEFSEARLAELAAIAVEAHRRGLVGALGEIGLDYDRLHYLSKEQQRDAFRRQLEVLSSLKLDLPFFLHMRAACDDFVAIVAPFVANGLRGVVHSFTGSENELARLLQLGFYIGVNGCLLKTEANLQVALQIPRDRVVLETDAPWCEIRKSHAGYKYLTPYPNQFYPAVPEPAVAPPTAPKGKPSIKMDELLPFAVVKKGNFARHHELAQRAAADAGHDLYEAATGAFAWPLMQSRNEPVYMGQVAQIMCGVYGIGGQESEAFLDGVYERSCAMFS